VIAWLTADSTPTAGDDMADLLRDCGQTEAVVSRELNVSVVSKTLPSLPVQGCVWMPAQSTLAGRSQLSMAHSGGTFTIGSPQRLRKHIVPLPSPDSTQYNYRHASLDLANQHLTVMSMELHCASRMHLLPDPHMDAIEAICYAIQDDDIARRAESDKPVLLVGCIVVSQLATKPDAPPVDPAISSSFSKSFESFASSLGTVKTRFVANEAELLAAFVETVRQWDPDMIVGFEVQNSSWGYLFDRAKALDVPLIQQLSRAPDSPVDRRNGADTWGDSHGSGIWVIGRVVLNMWRILRGELKLSIYTFESIVWEVLRQRMPRYHQVMLAKWFGAPRTCWYTLQYYVNRAAANLAVFAKLDLIGRTSEMARLFGIDFFSVLTRGSQYRVEAVMCRISRPLKFVMPSPSRDQVASQAAMECLPLVMEPRSRFYSSPVCVLDFQSLYPSIIIAYNMCYSTCLGRVSLSSPALSGRLGFSNYSPPLGAVSSLHKRGFLTPNGVLFAPKEHRRGVLPTMLAEILATRLMVKKAMKRMEVKDDPVLTRVMDARQYALKMIANVTYGYTSAGFSGRMPCCEISDAIVQTARTVLESSVRIVESEPSWRAKVVYGDTDSMFVLLEDRSRDEAFAIGEAIAAKISATFPSPITLKFEKVYDPCVLLTKKRYVGDMFESRDQPRPTLDCKGIEVVRRDQCPLVVKTYESALKILFRRRDLSAVKRYLVRQWGKVLTDRLPLGDFVFAKEVKFGSYARENSLPPAAIVASRSMMEDPRAAARYGERVPYVVVAGEPGARLVDLVVSPHDVLRNPQRYKVNAKYYVSKQILPVLARAFNLVGVDISKWFHDMHKPVSRRFRAVMGNDAVMRSATRGEGPSTAKKRQVTTIEQFYFSDRCEVCGKPCKRLMCDDCTRDPALNALILFKRANVAEAHLNVGGGA
jgi:DNA polymerase zeta